MSADRSTNPLFSSRNRLKLGLFCTNMMPAMTTAPELFDVTWPNMLSVARMADDMRLEAVVAVARWKGYVEDDFSHVSNVVFDPFVYAAAMSQATSYSSIFATTHAPTVHPVFLAKQCATIDHISGGRFTLNIVGGWNRPEFDMFGIPMREHDARYTYLEEWLALVQRLWTASDEFDYASDTFTLKGALSRPQPLQPGGIPIMNAGMSDRGRDFAAEHADICLIPLRNDDPSEWARQVSDYKDLARTRFGREIQVWTPISITVRDTTEEAEAYVRRISVEMFDEAAADGFLATQVRENPNIKGDLYELLRNILRSPSQSHAVTGSPSVVIERLTAMADAGLDGVIVAYADIIGELERLRSDVLPLMEQAGLREPHVAAADLGATATV